MTTETTSIGDLVTTFLARLETEATNKLQTARRMVAIEPCNYTHGELTGAKYMLSVIRMIRCRLPANWFKESTGAALTQLQIVAAASKRAKPRPHTSPQITDFLATLNDADLQERIDNVNATYENVKAIIDRGSKPMEPPQ